MIDSNLSLPDGHVLAVDDIRAYMNRPLPDRLFISPILDEDLQFGACSVDLRLGLDFRVTQKSRMTLLDLVEDENTIDRQIQKSQEVIRVNLGEPFILHPQQPTLASTLEYVRLPDNLTGIVASRSSWNRLFVQVAPASIFPGFAGVITLTLLNHGDTPIVLRPGFRIAQLMFYKLVSPARHESRYGTATGASASMIHHDRDLRLFGPVREPKILGIVSTLGAGRTEVVRHLLDRGFQSFALSKYVREEAVNSGLDPNRNRLQEVGANLRTTLGDQYLAVKMVRELDRTSALLNAVVDGIKHPAEVIELRKKRFFKLLAVDAPPEMRFQRLQQRRRIGDPQTFDDFLQVDHRDRGVDGPENGQRVDEVINMADYAIQNVGTLAELRAEVDRAIDQFFGDLAS